MKYTKTTYVQNKLLPRSEESFQKDFQKKYGWVVSWTASDIIGLYKRAIIELTMVSNMKANTFSSKNYICIIIRDSKYYAQ
jgi:hypothetical protein